MPLQLSAICYPVCLPTWLCKAVKASTFCGRKQAQRLLPQDLHPILAVCFSKPKTVGLVEVCKPQREFLEWHRSANTILTSYLGAVACRCLCGILHHLKSQGVWVRGAEITCSLSAPWRGVCLCFVHLPTCLWSWSFLLTCICAKQILTCRADGICSSGICLCLTSGRSPQEKGRQSASCWQLLLWISSGKSGF